MKQSEKSIKTGTRWILGIMVMVMLMLGTFFAAMPVAAAPGIETPPGEEETQVVKNNEGKIPLKATATVESKVYDGTTDAKANMTISSGLEDGDRLMLGTDYTVEAVFTDPNFGTDKEVSVTITAVENSSAMSKYYFENNKITVSATIYQRTVDGSNGVITGLNEPFPYTENEIEPSTVTISPTMEKTANEITELKCDNQVYGNSLDPRAKSKYGATISYAYKVQGADDSTYTDDKPKKAGNYTVKATAEATNEYSEASATKDFEITKALLSANAATAAKAYDGGVKATVNWTAVANMSYSEEVVWNVDYTVTATFHTADAGRGKPVAIKFEAKDTEIMKNYVFEKAEFDIKGDINQRMILKENTTIKGIEKSYVYTGKAIEPIPSSVSVKIEDGTVLTLKAGTDYTVSYTNNKSVNKNGGIYVQGIGNYQYSVYEQFAIIKSPSALAVSLDQATINYGDTFTISAVPAVKKAARLRSFEAETDTVDFYLGSDIADASKLGSADIDEGKASLRVEKTNENYPEVGANQVITAVYGGSRNLEASTGDAMLTVNKSNTTLSITTPAETVVEVGELVQLTLLAEDERGDHLAGSVLIFGKNLILDEEGQATITYTPTDTDEKTITADFTPESKNYNSTTGSITLKAELKTRNPITQAPVSVMYGSGDKTLTPEGGSIQSGEHYSYAITEGQDSVSVDAAGVLHIKKPGSAVLTISLPASNTYNSTQTTVQVTIEKADLTGISFESKNYAYDGKTHDIVITGTLPEDGTVIYENNTGIEPGVYKARAKIQGGANYKNLILSAELTIGDRPVPPTPHKPEEAVEEIKKLPTVQDYDKLTETEKITVKGKVDAVVVGIASMSEAQQLTLPAAEIEKLSTLYGKANNVQFETEVKTDGAVKNPVSSDDVSIIGGEMAAQIKDGTAKIILTQNTPPENAALAFTAKLYINGDSNPVQLKTPVMISVKLPKGIKTEGLMIKHIKTDGSSEMLTPVISGETASFTTASFSNFIFTEKSETPIPTPVKNPVSDTDIKGKSSVIETTENPTTGALETRTEAIKEAIVMIIAAGLMVGVMAFVSKRKTKIKSTANK